MGGNGNGNLNMRNWGFLETPTTAIKNHLDLQLMPSVTEKPLFGTNPSPMMASTNGGPFHHHRVGGISESHIHMDYWMNQNRGKYLNIIFGNDHHPFYQSSYGISPESSSARSVQNPQPINLLKDDNVVPQMHGICEERENGDGKKRSGGKVPNRTPKEKKPRTKTPRAEPTPSTHRARAPKKPAEIEINGMNMDISDIPVPVCSCTGTPQQCYRWGSGGWQSACCTTGLSMYPLPMSTKRRGARIAGRKMSIGAFKKVLEKLTNEGYNFSSPIDLRSYWAKHGTNKFVTIR
ncbi:hypothetical protein OROMI_033634 [Orobanche minor]